MQWQEEGSQTDISSSVSSSTQNRFFEELLQEELKQVVTFEDCVFRDNFVDDSMSFPGIIENTFNSELVVKNCLFQNNVYGNTNNPASTGYAIRSFGPLTLESSCFIDNVFLNHGPVLVYGAQYSALNNYVESSQTGLTCELGALFSSQDDMAENIPSCESSDANTCAFSQDPTVSPTIAPSQSPVEQELSSKATDSVTPQGKQASSAAVTVTRISAVGTAVLSVFLVLCLSVFDL